MNEISLSKDADKMICVIYKDYLEKRKNGASKSEAKDFRDFPDRSGELFPKWNHSDIMDTFREVSKAFGIKMDIIGGFELNDAAIIYMENRFPDGLKQVLETLGAIKGIIPFI